MNSIENIGSGGAAGDKFLRTYAHLESWMRQYLRKDAALPYKRMIDELRARAAITDTQALQLATFGYLRNALAHWERTSEGVAIADPRPDTLAQFESLAERVMKPASAIAAIGPQTVLSVDRTDRVDDFLAIVRQHNYSQVPVMSSGFLVGIITVGALARWLAGKRWNTQDDFRRAQISTVPLDNVGDPDFVARSPSLTAPEAIAAFNVEVGSGAISGIVLVDKQPNGDQILAMILPWDLPALLRATQPA